MFTVYAKNGCYEVLDVRGNVQARFSELGYAFQYRDDMETMQEMRTALTEIIADLQFSEVEQHRNLVTIARAAIKP